MITAREARIESFPNSTYFNNKLKFGSHMDQTGRIRLAAFTIGEHTCKGG